MIALVLVMAALTDLTRELLRAFPPPAQCATGSSPVIVVPEELSTPGLVTCPKCGTPQRPMQHRFAVHFATLTSARPCAGSWP